MKINLISAMLFVQVLVLSASHAAGYPDDWGHAIRDSAPEGVLISEIRPVSNGVLVHGIAPSNKKVSEYMRKLVSYNLGDLSLVMIQKDAAGAKFILNIKNRTMP